MFNNNIAILLSTYNGEKYLAAQLESLLKQSYKNWVCFIRDDYSIDKTVDLIEKYTKKYPCRFQRVITSGENLRPCKSFLELLVQVDSSFDYIMFCDQDDVWDENKIDISLKVMKESENKIGIDTPILVHSDLEVVNENLELVSKSMKLDQKVNFKFNEINYLVIQNIVTGCTMMINKELRNLVKNIPNNAVMHDWWLAILASCFGEIVFIDKPLIKYRQHNNNSIGAKKINVINSIMKLKRNNLNKIYNDYINMMEKSFKQAKEFFEIYKTELDQESLDVLDCFLSVKNKNRFKRTNHLREFNIKGQNHLTNVFYKTIITIM